MKTKIIIASLFAFAAFGISESNAQYWSVTGNSGTSPSNNFVGTTDAADLGFRVNNVERMRLSGLGIGSLNLGQTAPHNNHTKLFIQGGMIQQSPPYGPGVETIAEFRGQDIHGYYTRGLIMQRVSSYDGTFIRFDKISTNGGSNIPVFNVSLNNGVVIGNVPTRPGYQLFVEQGILTEKVKVAIKTTSDWSDYVFAPEYKLKSLNEVESFVTENKHLPGVPSAAEVVDQGLDLAKMDAKLLEKIEELTLYTIQQEKDINTLKKTIETLVSQNEEMIKLIQNTSK